MDGSTSSDLKSDTQPSKKKKVVEKTVVTVKIEANGGKLKNDGPPSDFWSWRKYGQKPIKGSPYPRGYYRCSTSKGCSAKKQVERSRTDASVLIITYTSNHNHPGPDLRTTNLNQQPKDSRTQPISEEQDHPTTPKQEHENEAEKHDHQLTDSIVNKDEREDHNFHYCCQETQEENPFINVDSDFSDKTQSASCGVLNEEPICCPRAAMAFSTQKSEENDFFDELEELPTYSSFTSFMRSNFHDERIPIVPS